MHKTSKRFLSFFLVGVLLFSITACAKKQPANYEKYQLLPKENLDADFLQGGYQFPEGAQLTVDDIQAMNGGHARVLYNDEGYVTFINGKYSNLRVTDHESAVATIQQVAGLLGLNAGSEFFANFVSKDKDDYSYYTFQQRCGELTVEYAILRVIVDPQGYTAGLSCSFTPNIGIQESEDVGEEVALEKLKAYLIKDNDKDLIDSLHFYPEATHKVAITYFGTTYSAYAFYCDNIFKSNFEMRYLEFFVTESGLIIPSGYPVASFGIGNEDVFRNEEYFEHFTATNMEFTVTLFDDSKTKVTVPVSYNDVDGKYYLADPERLIIVGDYSSMNDDKVARFTTSTDPLKWRNQDLIVYDRYIKAYDYYAALGLKSVDGSGIPIYIGTKMPRDNASYCGIHNGWAMFAASDMNTFSESMDVVGHEYTHGIMRNSMMAIKNCGHTGAISESMADIMGNLMEQILEMTNQKWICGERMGQILRSMSDPNRYKDPISIYDPYYVNPEDMNNDSGGVHSNAALLNQMAYKLDTAGMTMEEQRSLWLKAIEMMTPRSDFPEVLEALIMSNQINGFDDAYEELLWDAFDEAGLTLNRKIVTHGAAGGAFAEYTSEATPYSFLYPGNMTTNYTAENGTGLFVGDINSVPYLLVHYTDNANTDVEKYFKSVDKQVLTSFTSVSSTSIHQVEIDGKTLYMTRYQGTQANGKALNLERYLEPHDKYSIEYTAVSYETGELNTALYYAIRSMKVNGETTTQTDQNGLKEYSHPDFSMTIELPNVLSVKELTIGYIATNADAMILALRVTADDAGNPIANRDAFLSKAAEDTNFMASYLGVDTAQFGEGSVVTINGHSYYSYPITMTTQGETFEGTMILADGTAGGCYLVCYGVKPSQSDLKELCEKSLQSIRFE